ncbi:unnamed protein product [Urochloa humidicola]
MQLQIRSSGDSRNQGSSAGKSPSRWRGRVHPWAPEMGNSSQGRDERESERRTANRHKSSYMAECTYQKEMKLTTEDFFCQK